MESPEMERRTSFVRRRRRDSAAPQQVSGLESDGGVLPRTADWIWEEEKWEYSL